MAKGRQSTNGTIVASPTDMDVLCSKDKSTAKHPGNLVFRERIEQVTARYSVATSKQEKMKITRDIVAFMRMKHGSRFLKLHSGGAWVEITDQSARDKVSHALRFAAKNAGVAGGPSKKQRQQVKKARKRPSVSSESSASSNSIKSDSSTDLSAYAADYTPEPIVTKKTIVAEDDYDFPVTSIYMRQQNILSGMQTSRDGYMDFAEFQAKSLSNMPPPEFNTLRSEDLNDLLRDPMFNSIEEWEVVEQMAEC